MLHVSILLFGAHDNESSRHTSAVLAIFLGTIVSLCSFQSGVFLARCRCLALSKHAQPVAATLSDPKVGPSESSNFVCAPASPDMKQPAESSSNSAELAQESQSMPTAPIESVHSRATKELTVAVATQEKQSIGDAQSCTPFQRGVLSSSAGLLITSSVCLALSSWLFSSQQHEWASFWLAGLVAPVGAVLRWHLGVLNATPKSMPLYLYAHLTVLCLPSSTVVVLLVL